MLVHQLETNGDSDISCWDQHGGMLGVKKINILPSHLDSTQVSPHRGAPLGWGWGNAETAEFKPEMTEKKTGEWFLWLDSNFHHWAEEWKVEFNSGTKVYFFLHVWICGFLIQTLYVSIQINVGRWDLMLPVTRVGPRLSFTLLTSPFSHQWKGDVHCSACVSRLTAAVQWDNTCEKTLKI